MTIVVLKRFGDLHFEKPPFLTKETCKETCKIAPELKAYVGELRFKSARKKNIFYYKTILARHPLLKKNLGFFFGAGMVGLRRPLKV